MNYSPKRTVLYWKTKNNCAISSLLSFLVLLIFYVFQHDFAKESSSANHQDVIEYSFEQLFSFNFFLSRTILTYYYIQCEVI